MKNKLASLLEGTPDDPLSLVPSDLMPLIPGFLKRREIEVTELGLYLEKRDFASIQSIGHKLKGTGTGYGFPIMTEIGRVLEDAAKKHDQSRIRASIDELWAVTNNLILLVNQTK